MSKNPYLIDGQLAKHMTTNDSLVPVGEREISRNWVANLKTADDVLKELRVQSDVDKVFARMSKSLCRNPSEMERITNRCPSAYAYADKDIKTNEWNLHLVKNNPEVLKSMDTGRLTDELLRTHIDESIRRNGQIVELDEKTDALSLTKSIDPRALEYLRNANVYAANYASHCDRLMSAETPDIDRVLLNHSREGMKVNGDLVNTLGKDYLKLELARNGATETQLNAFEKAERGFWESHRAEIERLPELNEISDRKYHLIDAAKEKSPSIKEYFDAKEKEQFREMEDYIVELKACKQMSDELKKTNPFLSQHLQLTKEEDILLDRAQQLMDPKEIDRKAQEKKTQLDVNNIAAKYAAIDAIYSRGGDVDPTMIGSIVGYIGFQPNFSMPGCGIKDSIMAMKLTAADEDYDREVFLENSAKQISADKPDNDAVEREYHPEWARAPEDEERYPVHPSEKYADQ